MSLEFCREFTCSGTWTGTCLGTWTHSSRGTCANNLLKCGQVWKNCDIYLCAFLLFLLFWNLSAGNGWGGRRSVLVLHHKIFSPHQNSKLSSVSPALGELADCHSCPAGSPGPRGCRTHQLRGRRPGRRPPRTQSRTWSHTWSRRRSRTSGRTRSCTQSWSLSDTHCHTRSEARDLIWPATCSAYKARYQNNSNRLQSSSGTFWSI